MNSKTAADIANKKLKELGFTFTVPNTKLQDGKNVEVKSQNVDLSKLGVASHIFKNLKVVVWVGFNHEEEFVRIALKYSYNHFSGSNGYEVSFGWRDNKWTQYS